MEIEWQYGSCVSSRTAVYSVGGKRARSSWLLRTGGVTSCRMGELSGGAGGSWGRRLNPSGIFFRVIFWLISYFIYLLSSLNFNFMQQHPAFLNYINMYLHFRTSRPPLLFWLVMKMGTSSTSMGSLCFSQKQQSLKVGFKPFTVLLCIW